MKSKRWLLISVAILFSTLPALISVAGEHPGAEHPGSSAEHSGKPAEGDKGWKGSDPTSQEQMCEVPAKVTAQDIKDAISSYVKKDVALKGGYFLLYDARNAKPWVLTFSKIHDPVSVINEKSYFACTDFKSGKDILDIDFWFEPDADGKLRTTKISIHKDNGKPRYTFDNDKPVEVK